jgi:hypothetical protein
MYININIWWGFISLLYNFTPRFVSKIKKKILKSFLKNMAEKLYYKMAGRAGIGSGAPRGATVDADMQQKELDRLNRWAQSQAPPH